MIIAVLNLKGGAGKTTVSVNLAKSISNQKTKTLLLDTDKQGSTMKWFDTRETEKDDFTVISITEPQALKKQIFSFKNEYDCIIVDGAPHNDTINSISIFASDIIIIPVAPSPFDIWSTADMLDKIRSAQEIMPDKLAYFLLNKVNEQTSLSKDAEECLKTMGFPIFKTKLHNRIAYADSAAYGKTILESNNSKGKEEFLQLTSEIIKIGSKK